MSDSTEVQETSGSDSEPEYDIESYRHAITEARRTLDQQLKAFNDVNGKAWRIVQLNGIIASVYIAAVANALDGLNFTPLPALILILGLVLLGLSAYFAATGQNVEKITIGQGSDAFESVRKNDPSEIAYLYKTLEDYEQWIVEANAKTDQNGKVVNRAKWLLIGGVVLITAGTVIAIVT